MPGFEPGPIAPALLPLGPRVSRPGLFLHYAAELEPALVGVDAGLATARGTIAPLVDTDLETPYQTDVAPAIVSLSDLAGVGNGSELAGVADAGDALDSQLGASAGDLPAPGQAEPDAGLYQPIEPEPTGGGGDGGGFNPEP